MFIAVLLYFVIMVGGSLSLQNSDGHYSRRVVSSLWEGGLS